MSSDRYPLYDLRNPAHEKMRRQVLGKIDLHTIPTLTLLYLACFIDRTNIGNAKVAGLEKDLGLQGIQFNISLAVFCITYILVELPSNHILNHVGARIWLPFLVFCWGTVTIFGGLIKNFSSLIVIRVLLGLFEGGLLPGMVLYLSSIYKANELQIRIGCFFSASPLSGALGGLISYAITGMDGVCGKPTWAWIFILEGMATILIAIVGWVFLFSNLESASFLDATERNFAVNRLRCNGVTHHGLNQPEVDPKGAGLCENNPTDVDPFSGSRKSLDSEPFEWKEVIRGLRDPQVWFVGLAATTLSISMLTLGFFLPTLVKGMGHTGSQAQLFSAFPYMPATVLVWVISFLADKWQIRGPMVLALLPITMAGYLLLIFATSVQARYAGVFFVAAGAFPSIPALLCILPNNTSGTTKRATVTALQAMLGNLAAFGSPFVLTPDQAPLFVKGHTISFAFVCVSWVFVVANVLYCQKENAARVSGHRDSLEEEYLRDFDAGRTRAPLGDRDPTFLFTL